MGDPFIGEVRLFGFDFAPRGWAACNGQQMQIVQNQALYALIGIQFGGDGKTNFNLPNLQGRVAMGAGNGPGLTPRTQGIASAVGADSVAITDAQMPWHTHTLTAQGTNAALATPNAVSLSKGGKGSGKNFTPWNTYVPGSANIPLVNTSVSISGGNQAHENRQPVQVLNYCIAVNGLFPPRS